MEGVIALFITLVVALMPAFMFLEMWAGLDRLRDDDLLETLREKHGTDPRQVGGLPDGFDLSSAITESPGVRCPDCGARNREDVDYCKACLEQLP